MAKKAAVAGRTKYTCQCGVNAWGRADLVLWCSGRGKTSGEHRIARMLSQAEFDATRKSIFAAARGAK